MNIINFLLDDGRIIVPAVGLVLTTLVIFFGLRRIQHNAGQVANGKAIAFPSHPFFSRRGWSALVIFRRVREGAYILEVFRNIEDAQNGKIWMERFIYTSVPLPMGIKQLTVGPKVPNGFQIT